MKILHASPISPRVASKRLVRVQRPVGIPGRVCVPRGMTNGVGGGVGARGAPLEADPESESGVRKEKPKPSSSESASVCKRSEVKNSAKVTPRLHASMANASYVREPKRSSGAR